MAAASKTYSATENHRRYFSGENKSPTTTTNLIFELNEFDVWNATTSPELHKTLTRTRTSNKPSPSPAPAMATENRRAVGSTAFSLPVDVPNWSMILKNEVSESENRTYDDGGFDDGVYGGGDVIPPHEYLARGRMASFSVHEGLGRTLKGRDLSRVRNAVWKKIGFED